METLKKLLERLNKLKIEQTEIEWLESLPDDVWKNDFKDKYQSLQEGLDVEKHRWYEFATSVIKLGEHIIGIKHIQDIFSESMDCSDISHQLEFFEMKEVKVISYVRA